MEGKIMHYTDEMSRRDFLKTTGIALGTGGLVGMGPFAREASATGKAKVAVGIARGKTVGNAVRKAVELAGGMDFIKSGQTILIKPNVNTGTPYPGSTNPEVLHEVIKLVWERDPKRVIVGDRSMFMRTTMEEMRRARIDTAALDAKAELVTFDYMRWEFMNPTNSFNWKKGYHVAEIISQVDHIINVPVIKTHRLAWFTMSIKNFVGIIHANDRRVLHSKMGGFRRSRRSRETGQQPKADYPTFAKMIAELGLIVKPSLNIMDGTKAFVSDGPSRGDVVEPKLIVASRDRIATDVTGLGILKHYGTEERIQNISVWKQHTIARGIEIGLGVSNLSQIGLEAENVPELEEINAQMI
jgi:uncharacterized protein (DUF362 family)